MWQNFSEQQKHVSRKLQHKDPFKQRLRRLGEKGAGPQKDSRSGAIITSGFPKVSRQFRKVIPGFAGEGTVRQGGGKEEEEEEGTCLHDAALRAWQMHGRVGKWR